MQRKLVQKQRDNLQVAAKKRSQKRSQHQRLSSSPRTRLTEHPPVASATPHRPQWSASLDAILEQPPASLPLRLTYGGIAFAAGFAFWSWCGQINELGHATGTLVPRGDAFSLQASIPGKITQLVVEEGDVVEQGDLIATIENELAEDEVERLEQSIFSKHMEISQQQGLKTQNLLMSQNIQTRNQADIQAQDALISQIKAKKEMLAQLIQQQQRDIAGYRQRLSRILPLVEAGVISLDYTFELEQSLRDRESILIESQGNLQQANTEELQILAQRQQKQSEAQNSEIEAEKQLHLLDMQIASLNSAIAESETRLNSALSQLQQHSLYAPVTGTVSSLNIKNIGEVVQPGQSIAEFHIVDNPLVLQAVLPSEEAGFVEVGMPTKVKLDAYPYQKYGLIEGKIIFISPDAKQDPKIGMVYQLEIQLERNSIQEEGRTIALQPGQTATADIIIRERRIVDIILEPISGLKAGNITF